MIILWIVAIIIACGVALYFIGSWLFYDPRQSDEIHYVRTADGWDLGVQRFLPQSAKKEKTPVILQHGLTVNHRNFDYDDEHSLSQYLARAGYDCFLPDLRGIDLSQYRRWGYPNKWNIGFEDYVDHDLPAVVEHVLRVTGAKKVHFVGHSMGGIIGTALAQGETASRMKSLTSIAGPANFDAMGHFKPLLRFQRLLHIFPVMHENVYGRIIAPLIYLFPRAARRLVNPDNVDRRVLAIGGVNLLSPAPSRLMMQFAKWVETGIWGSHNGRNYQSHLGKIKIPIFGIAGTLDFFCPVPAITPVIEQARSKKKKMRIFSKENGDMADYGHGDLIVGHHAPEEIFPAILDWLQQIDHPAGKKKK